jgi:uncharacterized DUF497 family protein
MEFEWDEQKDKVNRRKHGISFEEATAIWSDPASVTIPTVRAEDGEERFKTVGVIEGRLFVVVWTARSGIIRIVSARRTNASEERAYGHR